LQVLQRSFTIRLIFFQLRTGLFRMIRSS